MGTSGRLRSGEAAPVLSYFQRRGPRIRYVEEGALQRQVGSPHSPICTEGAVPRHIPIQVSSEESVPPPFPTRGPNATNHQVHHGSLMPEQRKTAPSVNVALNSERGTSRNTKSDGENEEGNGLVKSGERSGGGRWRKTLVVLKNLSRSAAHSQTNKFDLWNGIF